MNVDPVQFNIATFNQADGPTPKRRFIYLLSLASMEFALDMDQDQIDANAYFNKYYANDVLAFEGKSLYTFSGKISKLDTVSIGDIIFDRPLYTNNLYNLLSHMSGKDPGDTLSEDMVQLQPFFEGGIFEMMSKASYFAEVDRRKRKPIMIIAPPVMDLRFMISKEYRSLYIRKHPWAEERLHSFIEDEMKGKISRTFSEISYPEEVIEEETEMPEDMPEETSYDLEF